VKKQSVKELKDQIIESAAPIRLTLDQIASKWSVLVITTLCEEPQRFNAMKRKLNGVTQKSLTETLRKLESNGLITRRVIPVSPVAVEYSITLLGKTLQEPFNTLCSWALRHQADVEAARKSFALREAKHITTVDGIR
jgi:DNA-binding HxlR family transcriptional regulator